MCSLIPYVCLILCTLCFYSDTYCRRIVKSRCAITSVYSCYSWLNSYAGDKLNSHVAAYDFAPLLRKELCEFKNRWNLHRIRWNRFAVCPCDVPNDVYYLSSQLGMLHCKLPVLYMYNLISGNNYRKCIDVDLLAHCILKYTDNVPPFYPSEFQVLADTYWFFTGSYYRWCLT